MSRLISSLLLAAAALLAQPAALAAEPAAPAAAASAAADAAPAPRPDDTQAERARAQPGNNAPFWRGVRDSGQQAGYSSLPGAENPPLDDEYCARIGLPCAIRTRPFVARTASLVRDVSAETPRYTCHAVVSQTS